MPRIRSKAIRIKRFRDLKENLRTRPDRLLVGIDIAKAQPGAQVRRAHTQLLDRQLTIPNTQAGFEIFWAPLAQRQAETGCRELVCAVEPPGPYHEALAQFREAHGADVLLVSNTVAHANRRTLDGTWGKSDPKDAHHLGDLLERGLVLFYWLPDSRVATLRRLVRLRRQARVKLGACDARFRNTLLPLLGPAGEPPPPALVASLPAPLQVLLPPAQRRGLPAGGGPLPPALAFECTDLAARLTAVQMRITQLEAELIRVANPLGAYARLRTIPGVGPRVAAILRTELGDIAWDTHFSQLRKRAGLDIQRVQTRQFTGTARSPAWRARREALIATRGQTPAHRLGRVAEGTRVRSGPGRSGIRGPAPPLAGPPRGPTIWAGAHGDRAASRPPGWSSVGQGGPVPAKGDKRQGLRRVWPL